MRKAALAWLVVAAVSVVGAPVARATTNTYSLNGVAAISAASAWAVGYFIHGSGHSRTLIEHWNGAAWRVKASPNVGTGNNTLNGVVAISRSNAWAVGSYTGASGHRRTLVEHWNGAGWKVKASPNVGTGNNSLNGVDATSGTNAWAVGSRSGGRRTLIERWNGSAWRVKASPNVGTSANRLTGVAVTGAGNAWAVGSRNNGTRTLIEHWNGTAWGLQRSRNPGNAFDYLAGVDAASVRGAWAVGSFANSSGPLGRTLVLHWNGTAWKVQASPNVGSSADGFSGAAAVSAGRAWAAGFSNNSARTLIERWNGSVWRIQSAPNPVSFDFVTDVAATSSRSAWAVGSYDNGARTLIDRWNGTAWSVQSSPNP